MAREGWTLDGLDLNDGTSYMLQSVEFLPARKRIQWAENPDSDGSLPVGETNYDNAEWIGKVRIVPQTTRALALTKRAALTAKLQNCAGEDFVWTNSGGTELTWYCLTAEYDEVPYDSSGDGVGYHLNFPVMTVRIVCRPFGYGAEVVGSDTTYATPLGSLALTAVPGDVDAEATLVVTDNATQPRKHIEVGLEHSHYVAASPFDLFLDEGDLSVTGTQAAAVADGDAYTPGNAFELKPLFAGWQDLCSKADMTHRGSFRVKARAKNTADEEEVSLRLLWRVGNTPYTPNDSVVVSAFATASYVEVDLGTINVPAGTANLDIFIQARSDTITAAGEGVRLDYLALIPTERYGVGAGETVALGGSALAVADEFNHDLGLVLTGKTPDFGAAWVGGGDADDFAIRSGGGVVSRYATAGDADLNTGRYVAAGGSLTNCEVGCAFDSYNAATVSGKELRSGVIARYADASNWVGAFVRNKKTNSGRLRRLAVYKRVAGTVTKLAEIEVSDTSLYQSGGYIYGALSMSVSAAGVIVVKTGPSAAAAVAAGDQVLTVSDGSLPASGKVGLYSAHDFASSQSSAGFFSIVGYSGLGATTETYAIPSGGRIEIGSSENTTYTAASGGDPAPFITRGSRFYLPVGDSRITIKARRNDVDSGTDLGLTDSTKARYAYTPRYLLPPAVVEVVFDPSDISGLQGWWKADAITGLSDGDAISQWDDSSGNANHATAAGAQRPVYKTGILNGESVVRTAAGQWLDLPAIAVSAFSAFWVSTVDSKQAYGGPLSLRGASQSGFQVSSGTSTTNLRVESHTWNGSAEANHKIVVDAVGASLPVAARVYSLVFDNAVAPVLYFDGVLEALQAGSASWGNGNTIGKGYAEQRGDYAELLVYNTNLGDPDRTAIEDYLATKWGI